MTTWQITCINKTDRYNPHERIRSVGGPGGWKKSVPEVISSIRAGDEFWVSVGGKRVKVIIASKDNHPYIKTEADGEQPNNLLSLPECP